jgi:Leucine-rich repeat (LRR) protein
VIDDLWKETAWDAIKLAFQYGHPGSKIIITTRKWNVAEHICGGVYELKPLSDDDSRKLLYKRIFDTEDGCPPSFVEVAGKIIKKCGGVPLAIITTASLLASRAMHLEEWERVNKSIGSGLLGHSLDGNKMRKILSLSYNDLPFHLKTCLLSLSKYPEDQLIRKDVLVWSWIAEGFIKHEETQGPAWKSLLEIAESYFNDLINRSLIQPAQSHAPSEQDGQVHYCQVHDMVLELINHLSAEEGFVTVLSEDGQQAGTLTSAMQKRKIRRLSLHNNSTGSYGASPEAEKEQLSKVRSLDIFGKVTLIPPLSIFGVLRVLQVDDCSGLDNHHLNDLGKLRLLRFLRLHDLKIVKLPKSIGELESLETLDIRKQVSMLRPRRMVLPVSFAKLRKLVRLLANGVELPNGLTLKNMTSLREIVGIQVTLHAVTELGKLGELKVLGLYVPRPNESSSDRGWYVTSLMMEHGMRLPPSVNEWIVKCLQLCPSLQIFILEAPHFCRYPVDLMAQFPSGLRTFICHGGYFEKAFPKWTKPQLSYLTVLHLSLHTVCVLPEHIEQLAELPSLCFLMINSVCQSYRVQETLSSSSGFPCLTYLDLWSPKLFLKFQQGAMPKLQKLRLTFSPKFTFDEYNVFDYGLENLPSLRHVIIQLMGSGRTIMEMDDAIRKAVNDHPNHPSLDLLTKI